MASPERLSALDTTFLYTESPVAHMHVASLAILEDAGLTEEQISAHIASRLHLVPRFRKKLAWVPLQQGRPVWVDDPHFDLRFHIRHTGLPRPGDEEQALRLCGRLFSLPLDRTRPLWEMWLFQLADNRIALFQKTHHCLIDGISGVDLGTVILDLSKDSTPIEAPPWRPEPPPGGWDLLRDAMVERVTQPREMVRSVRAATRAPRALLQRARETAQGVFAFGKASLDFAPKTSLSQPIGPHRQLAIVRAKLAEVKELKNRFSCTVNDIVLAVVTGGLRRLLLSRGESLDGLMQKAMVPVSVRDPSKRMTYGNMVSMMTADLPVGEPDAVERVKFLRASMAGLKESKQAVGADFWVKMSEYAPPTVLALACRATSRQRMVNLIVTNVPGPQFPLWMRGGRMIEAFPFVPVLGTTSIGVAILSYDGQLDFGLTGDWDVVPDLQLLARGIEESLAELRAAVPAAARNSDLRAG